MEKYYFTLVNERITEVDKSFLCKELKIVSDYNDYTIKVENGVISVGENNNTYVTYFNYQEELFYKNEDITVYTYKVTFDPTKMIFDNLYIEVIKEYELDRHMVTFIFPENTPKGEIKYFLRCKGLATKETRYVNFTDYDCTGQVFLTEVFYHKDSVTLIDHLDL